MAHDGTCYECGKPAEEGSNYCLGHRYLESEIGQRMKAMFAAIQPRALRYRYFESPDGHLHAWTVEKDADGYYYAIDYKPIGPGARSGKATRWEMAKKTKRRQRKAAKAIALGWYEAARARKGSHA